MSVGTVYNILHKDLNVISSAWQCTCTLVVGGHKVPCQTQCDNFGVSAIFPRLVIAQMFSVSATKKCSERTTFLKFQGSYCKSDKSTDRSTEKWFPGMLPKSLRMLVKVHHCPLLWINLCNKPIPGTFWRYLWSSFALSF
jgi:hypothetical protein